VLIIRNGTGRRERKGCSNDLVKILPRPLLFFFQMKTDKHGTVADEGVDQREGSGASVAGY
jgi:hypothetical protein